MAAVTSSPMRATTTALPVPEEFDSLQSERDAVVIQGEYTSAAALQRVLERKKQEEDERHLQVLADKHQVEAMALERAQDEEFSRFVERWEQHMAQLANQSTQQEEGMAERHGREVQAFRANAEASVPKPKWSKDLLNLRTIEEHLARQKEFIKAAQVKAKADAREVEELQQNELTYWDKVGMEEAKLLQRQAKELDALRTRTTQQRDEAVVTQRRELEKLSKKFQVARIELSKSHGLAKVDLDWALKGWYNPRKGGLGPSPLVPASPLHISLMQPSVKLSMHRGPEGGSPSRRGPRSGASSAPGSPKGASQCGGFETVPPHSMLSSPGGSDTRAKPSLTVSLPSIPSALHPKGEPTSPSLLSRTGSPATGSGWPSPGSNMGQIYMDASRSPSRRGVASPKGASMLSPKGAAARALHV